MDQNLYLAEGDGIYALIADNTLDYEKIGADICNGNAQAVNARFEKSGVFKKKPKEYAAIQNILGITEVYLDNYDLAYLH